MWDKISSHFEDWGHPMRPNQEDVSIYQSLIGNGDRRLLLGMTEELLPFATESADLRYNGIDWLNMPYPKEYFDVIFGDGVLLVAGPELYDAVMPLLKPGGKFIARTFLRNTSPYYSDNIDIRKFQGLEKNFVPVQELYDIHGEYPTTRDYNGSSDVYFLPDLNHLPEPSAVVYPTYLYCEFYPVIVWTA